MVGSGVSGGWAAKELTEKGLKTLMLERGRPVEHIKDYITEHKGPWEFGMRGFMDRETLEKDYFIQKRAGFLNETVAHFFFKDSESPYIEEKPFTWIRGNQVGGKSLTWGRHCYRWSDLDFEANLKQGIGVDWPIRYADIAPWYDYVERFAGISGEKLGLPHLPDGQFQKPMELNVVEKHMRKRIQEIWPDRILTIGRIAVLTEPLNGRQPCHYCGPCWRGCSTGSYFSTQSTTLPPAVATGNLTLRPFSIVESIIYDKESGNAKGVRVIDSQTMETTEFYAKLIFLNASTLGSTHIMLNSKSEEFPNGIANSSRVLGHFLMDHHFHVYGSCEMPGFEDRYYRGNRPNEFYIPRFRNLKENEDNNFIRGYGIEGSAERANWTRGEDMDGFGVEFKKKLKDAGPWMVSMAPFGETLPRYANRVKIDETITDKYGIPSLVFNAQWGTNELVMRRDMSDSVAEIMEACGGKNIRIRDDNLRGEYGAEMGLGIHEMGTARMGRDPKTSILNKWNQCHDLPNLFVTDGACMSSSASQNPSITYMALTARAADYAVKQLKKGEL